jgi:hypothetical protein
MLSWRPEKYTSKSAFENSAPNNLPNCPEGFTYLLLSLTLST